MTSFSLEIWIPEVANVASECIEVVSPLLTDLQLLLNMIDERFRLTTQVADILIERSVSLGP